MLKAPVKNISFFDVLFLKRFSRLMLKPLKSHCLQITQTTVLQVNDVAISTNSDSYSLVLKLRHPDFPLVQMYDLYE